MIFEKSTFFKILIIVLIGFEGFSQPTLKFNIGSGKGFKGDTICVDVRVQDFVDISSMQFNISYNGTLVKPITPIDFSKSDLAPNIDNSNFNLTTKDNGYLKFVWDHSPSITMPDGALLFTICFELIGDPGNISPVYINSLALDVEICTEDMSGHRECVNYVNSEIGTVEILSKNFEAFVNRCDADVNNPGLGGSVSFYAAGGMAPYTYTINPGGYTGTLTKDGERKQIPNLPMGNYTLMVTDALGRNATKTFVVSSNLPIEIAETLKDPTCFNKRNGRIEIAAKGGLGPYKYEWSNYVSNTDINKDLLPGIYTLTVTDFNGCEVIRNYTLKADTIKFDIAVVDSTGCQEVKTGVVNIFNVQGGKPFLNGGYQYVINNTGNPVKFISPANAGKIGGGQVKVVVLDSLGCRVERELVMPVKKPFKFNFLELKDVSCHGLKDGSVMIHPIPDGKYNYNPDPKMINTGNLGGSFIATDLEGGSYTISARNSDGCSQSITFDVKDPDPISLNDVVIQPNCNDKGSITLNPTGGTGSFVYSWSTGNGNVSHIDEIIKGGTFIVTVTDANNCSTTKSFLINDYGTLSITVQSKSVSCQGKSDGSATVDIISNSGQIPMFQVIWKDASGKEISKGTTSIGNLPPGNYFVEVIDENKCSSGNRPFTINDAPELTIVTNISNPVCFGESGTITASVNGSVSGYTFEWEDKASGQIIDSSNVLTSKAGTYILKVRSQSGCENTQEIDLTQPAKLEFGTPDLRKVRCFGNNDGQAAILNGPTNYTYTWSSGAVGQFATDLIAGPGWVIAKLAGCTSDTVRFIIDTNPKLEIDNSKTVIVNPSCFGDTNGSISIEAVGGTGIGYKYKWENGGQSPLLNGIGAGSYTVTISDNNNCEQTSTLTLSQPDLLEVFLDNVKSATLDCNNTDKGRLVLGTKGGNTGVKKIQWQSGVETEGSAAINLKPGTYCATVTDNQGCSATFCHTLTAPVPLRGKLRTPAQPTCYGGSTCISVESITGGTGNAYTFQINNGKRYPIDSCATVYAGQYFISLIDSTGCSIDTTIVINQPNPLKVELGDDKDIQLGLPTPQILPFINATAGIKNVVWTPNDHISCLNSDCTNVEMTPPVTTTYVLTVTDNNGCTGSDDITIRVREVRNVYFANAFTPNNDGYNDYFQAVTGIGVERIVAFAIYDRWGNQVFIKENYVPDPAGTDGWDGTFLGRKLNPGVYVYYAKALFIDGKEIEYSGSVTLVDSARN
jgi:gliding motility-associated-like protein